MIEADPKDFNEAQRVERTDENESFFFLDLRSVIEPYIYFPITVRMSIFSFFFSKSVHIFDYCVFTMYTQNGIRLSRVRA